MLDDLRHVATQGGVGAGNRDQTGHPGVDIFGFRSALLQQLGLVRRLGQPLLS